jgi:diguanylate cyclase (GGDEF)-like protein
LHIVAFVEDITERRSTTERLERMALRDHLTGLGNRAALHQQLKQLLVQGQRDLVAVVYVDLDGFKEVNDSHGHEAGDELLRLTAQRLEASLRSHDFCARLGGDEFALVLTQLEKVEDVPPIAERLLAALGSPYHLTNFSVNVTASVGIAVAGTDQASDDLLRLADRAMYSAKQQGKNAWVIEPNASPEPDPPRS